MIDYRGIPIQYPTLCEVLDEAFKAGLGRSAHYIYIYKHIYHMYRDK